MKKTKKLPKRLVTLLLALATIVSSMGLTTILAFAWAHPDSVSTKEVELYTDQDKTYSSSKMGPNMYFEGKNLSATRSVHFEMQFYSGSDWCEDKKITISAGDSLEKQVTNQTRGFNTYWRLALYAAGPFKGARAVGWMW